MNTAPLVSIIVPTYNRVGYLEETLDSIFNQDYPEIEIIICDNCSTDGTQEFAQNLKETDSRIKYFRHDENIGMVPNHIFAINQCSGKYIHVFSDDDVMLPNTLKEKVMVMEQYANIGMLYSDAYYIDSEGVVIGENASFWDDSGVLDRERFYKHMYKKSNIVVMPTVFIKRKILIDNNLNFDLNVLFCMDYELWMSIALHSDIYFLKNRTVSYRIHQSNVSKIMNRKKLYNDYLTIKRKHTQKYSEHLKKMEIYPADIKLATKYQVVYNLGPKPTFFPQVKYYIRRIITLLSPSRSQQ